MTDDMVGLCLQCGFVQRGPGRTYECPHCGHVRTATITERVLRRQAFVTPLEPA